MWTSSQSQVSGKCFLTCGLLAEEKPWISKYPSFSSIYLSAYSTKSSKDKHESWLGTYSFKRMNFKLDAQNHSPSQMPVFSSSSWETWKAQEVNRFTKNHLDGDFRTRILKKEKKILIPTMNNQKTTYHQGLKIFQLKYFSSFFYLLP